MEKDLLMLHQLLMPVPMLMLGTDTMATTHMLIMDTTDHTDTGDTMARGLLMLNQLRSQNLAQMLMPVLTHGMDTTDHMDTDTGTERDLPMLSQLLMLMLALMLMLGMDTTAIIHMLIMVTTDHTDIGDTGERSKHKLTDNETIF